MHKEALLRCLKGAGNLNLFMHAANLNSNFYKASVYACDSLKLRPSAYRSVTEMVFTQEMQRVDRKLHLELAESPINPAFFTGRHLFQMVAIPYFTSK